MRRLALSLLATVSLPVCAAELQFNLSGDALPSGTSGTANIPFNVVFDLNTLGGTQSSFSISSPHCLSGWSFSGAPAAIVSATVGGKIVLQPGPAIASGNGEHPASPSGCELDDGTMDVGSLFWQEILTQNTTPLNLNPKDPLGDLFLNNLCHLEGSSEKAGCEIGFLPGWNLGVTSVKITQLAVPEPGYLGLILLGFAAVELRRRHARTSANRATH
jgi:hypothetical protein